MLFIETDFAAYEHCLEERLAALPPSWRARAERYKPFEKRLRSAIGYTMLALTLETLFDVKTLPEIQEDEHGKPHFVGYPLCFNISHCNTAVACVVDILPIAVDVQDLLDEVSPALAARIAAPDDAADFDVRALTERWTQKEASAKLDGRGLKIGLENLPMKEHRFEYKYGDNYVVCVAH